MIFEHLNKEIEESRYIYDLPDDWDEDLAMSIPRTVWEIATTFLLDYANHIYNNYNIIIDVPEINPTRAGNIDLSWTIKSETQTVGLLINIRLENTIPIASYYGYIDDFSNEFRGKTPCTIIDNNLVLWMKNLERKIKNV